MNELVQGEGGDVAKVNQTVRGLGGANPQVTQTPVLLRDNKGQFGVATLFEVTGPDGRKNLVDGTGAKYTDIQDYLKNNQLDSSWTVTRPANLGDSAGDPAKLVTDPAHATTGWDRSKAFGQQLTGAGLAVGMLPAAGSMSDDVRNAMYGKTLGTIAKYGGPAVSQVAPYVAFGLTSAGGFVAGFTSGHDLYSRYQHGRSVSWSDPQARSDYIDVGSGVATVAGFGAGGAGAAGAKGLATGLGLTSTAGAAPSLVGQGQRLGKDWSQLTTTQKVTHAAALGAEIGLAVAPPFAGKLAPKTVKVNPESGTLPTGDTQLPNGSTGLGARTGGLTDEPLIPNPRTSPENSKPGENLVGAGIGTNPKATPGRENGAGPPITNRAGGTGGGPVGSGRESSDAPLDTAPGKVTDNPSTGGVPLPGVGKKAGPVEAEPSGGPSHAPLDAANRTGPSRAPDQNAVPRGAPTKIRASDPVGARPLLRENESAAILAKAGYDVEQNPVVSGDKNPDYRIEGKIFDCVAPTTGRVRNISDRINEKIYGGQTERVVINLTDSTATADAMRTQLQDWPIQGLKEALVIDKQGDVIHAYP